MRLGYDRLTTLPAGIPRPRRTAPPSIGIVHFGPGAFHRAHQAAYVDLLLDRDPRWGIAAVSLRSRGTVDALGEQQGLYTLAIQDAAPCYRVIGAHGAWLGPAESGKTLALLAAPATRLVTITATEKGYCLAPDGTLDLAHPDIVRDLRGKVPASLIGWIVSRLAARRAAGVAPFVPMPCDNLADNGAKLHAALVAFARATDPALADWIASEVRVPATMVDSITPASDDRLIADVAAALGVEDAAPVQRESFAQWVIEDVGPIGPDLASVGAIVTSDVAGFKRAKLRILNGAHSTLAYFGLLRGRVSVADAAADPVLARFVRTMVADEIVPTLAVSTGFDLPDYVEAVFARFRNPAIIHRLDQIAEDGSLKLPYRLGEALAERRRAGAPPGRIAAAIGGWVAFMIARVRAHQGIIDPIAETLTEAARAGEPRAVVSALAGRGLPIAPGLLGDEAVIAAIAAAADAALAARWDDLLRR